MIIEIQEVIHMHLTTNAKKRKDDLLLNTEINHLFLKLTTLRKIKVFKRKPNNSYCS